jgi:hypothetical protein
MAVAPGWEDFISCLLSAPIFSLLKLTKAVATEQSNASVLRWQPTAVC